jgi:hypothetical protein
VLVGGFAFYMMTLSFQLLHHHTDNDYVRPLGRARQEMWAMDETRRFINRRGATDRRRGGDRRKFSKPYNGPEGRCGKEQRKGERGKKDLLGLPEKFHEAMINLCISAAQECDCLPISLSVFISLGGVQTAKNLLAGHIEQSGLFLLSEHGRLDLSVESLVLEEEYLELFEPQELSEARRRLGVLNDRSY